MLEDYLLRDDVKRIMRELRTNECYYHKNHYYSSYIFSVSKELALYIFYDALFKYKILVDDDVLLGRYLEQLEKLFRKINSFEQVRYGVHKLLGRMVAEENGIYSIEEEKEKLIEIIYHKYIMNGYLFHGFSSYYDDGILENGFFPEHYENYYERFQKVNAIFEKYGYLSAVPKDFSKKNIYFCDDLLLGCYYSMYSPMYFFQFLNADFLGKKIRKDTYLKDSYSQLIRPLKRFMENDFFRKRDKEFVLESVKNEWELLRKGKKEVCILCVPRNKVIMREVPLKRYLKSNQDVFEVIDRLLSSKYNNVCVNQMIPSNELKIIRCHFETPVLEKQGSRRLFHLLNAQGMVSLFFLVLFLGGVFLFIWILK